MAEPWIRVHANLADRPVIDRASHELGVSPHEAMGLLVQFWGAVSQHATNGAVGARTDAQLERWAGWTRKRGRFAAFVRVHHLDADGRVNEWDEYAGKLETRRENERERKRLERERRAKESQDAAGRVTRGAHRPADSPTDSHADAARDVTRTVTPVLLPTRANETIRDDTRVVVDDEERAETAAMIVAVVTDPPALTAIYVVIWANGAVTERWGEQPSPYTASQAESVALDLQTAGVEWSIAKSAIYRQCRESRRPDPPKSPAYFGPGVLKAWNQELARRAAVASGEHAPPRPLANTNGRHNSPNSATARSTPAPSASSPYGDRFKT